MPSAVFESDASEKASLVLSVDSMIEIPFFYPDAVSGCVNDIYPIGVSFELKPLYPMWVYNAISKIDIIKNDPESLGLQGKRI